MKATLTTWIKGLTSLTQQRKAGPAPVFHYKGFDIPQDLMLKTGGGSETFDVISRVHIYNLQRLVGIRPDDQIIEVGCGIGRDAIPLTEILSSRGSYLGVDIIEQSIAWCQSAISSRHPNFRFHHYDVQDQLHNPNGCTKTTDIRFSVEDGSIDRIILQSVFTHMFKSDILHYLREFRRVLKKDGRVYATLFLYEDASQYSQSSDRSVVRVEPRASGDPRRAHLSAACTQELRQGGSGCRSKDTSGPCIGVPSGA